jgi:type I restriction enzyme R subunit
VILDRQLQDTIYQFEHARGVVVKIDKDSAQLAKALAGEQARIIITTLQKFPFVLDKVGELPSRRYAVLIDEAHSSQTGDAAKHMKAVLAGRAGPALMAAETRAGLNVPPDEAALAEAEALDAAAAAGEGDAQDKAAALVAGRGRQANLSFFAFTATPKAKTLELFGQREDRGDGDRYYPFHLYSMKQAIDEGFVLDVLANYTTYKRYYRLEKAIREDPNYDEALARKAIARFIDLHPHNLAQKVEIIIEHFRQHVRHRIGGRAKAMVVTSSRLHAVRYKLAIDKYIREHAYPDIAVLVAFSGKVIDAGDEFTESGMNRVSESETAERFGGTDYQVLIVAEKFQTGFDQPLLHTMYVDKILTGLNAVQTLSRLNRIAPGKEDTFVLDFRNEVDEIQERVVVALTAAAGSQSHGAVYAGLDPAIDRFIALAEDDQVAFRDALTRFVNVYGFLSQVVPFTDPALERDWIYSRALDACLPGRDAERLDLGSEVQLSHLRIEQTHQGSASLAAGEGSVRAIFDGRGKQQEPDQAPLSEIIKVINERFGLHLDDSDRLLLEQYKAEMVADEELAAQARANDLEQFRIVFDRKFLNHIVARMGDNDAIFKRILDDEEFRGLLFDAYLRDVYDTLREGAA